ncbi:MAG: hypothetical protein N2050_02060 [Flavobacteriales bacterium]|nr:hypothetical protein [Flavobacteriales bacterium]
MCGYSGTALRYEFNVKFKPVLRYAALRAATQEPPFDTNLM